MGCGRPTRASVWGDHPHHSAPEVIDDHGGVVLEFIGDAIQCIYGAPLYNDNHPVVAVEDGEWSRWDGVHVEREGKLSWQIRRR